MDHDNSTYGHTDQHSESHELSMETDEEFPFPSSPSLDDAFQEATMVATLAETFSLTHFKGFQKDVIKATLEGRDSIVLQPTGSGKSLCFQFPPIYENKKAVVISPTISLMQDQVTNLRNKGISSIFLGSAQLDKQAESKALLEGGEERIIFVTPEWISHPNNKSKLRDLENKKQLSLIAIDEAYLVQQWQEFRPAYKELKALKEEFRQTPIMLLTATAPPEIESELQTLVRNPHVSKGVVDRPNIYFQCEEMESNDSKDFSYFARRVSEVIGNECAIIYTDFISHVGPIMSKLAEHGIDSVAYYGEMDPRSRTESYMKWKNGEVSVMVATTAFGMGINKPDIRHIVRYGVPESLCTWAQEFGRGGRDGGGATATILYSMANTDHGMAWIREHVKSNPTYCKRVLSEFSRSWKFVMAHLAGKCRRELLLKTFGEDLSTLPDNHHCCDVCDAKASYSMQECNEELSTLIDAVDTIGEKGELKTAQWIRGSSLAWTSAYDKNVESYGCSHQHQ